MESLQFLPPLDWTATLAFLRARATPGLEHVDEAGYRREGISITLAPDGAALLLDRNGHAPADAVRRARHLFDLDVDPADVERRLGGDPALRFRPGQRLPGCWDPFELLIRAIVGQQISVKAASTMMGRLHAAYRLTPESLAAADFVGIGLTRARAATVRAAAEAVLGGALRFDGAAPMPAIPGIGPWTAQYVAMRALKDRDAFPSGDLILRRAAAPNSEPLSPKQLTERAERWRPYRAYAVMALWRAYSEQERK